MRLVIKYPAVLSIVLFGPLFVCPYFAWGEVAVTVNPGYGTADDTFEVSVTVSDTRVSDIRSPVFSASPHFVVRKQGTSTFQRIVNGQQSFSLSFNFILYPAPDLSPGTYQLPPGEIEIAGVRSKLDQPSIQIIARGSPANNQLPGPSEPVSFAQLIDKTEVFVGEQLTYSARIVAAESFVKGEIGDFNPQGFLREKLGNDEQVSRNSGQYRITTVSEVLIPTRPGVLELPGRELLAHYRDNDGLQRRFGGFPSLFDDPFSATRSKRYRAKPLIVNVKALPEAPSGLTGYIPVGSLQLQTAFDFRDTDAETVAIGDSITLTLTLTGTANLRPLELGKSQEKQVFRRYDDKPSLSVEARGGKVYYRKVFKLALVPQQIGKHQLPVFTFSYFDPAQEHYQVLKSEGRLIEVKGSVEENSLGQKAFLQNSTGLDSETSLQKAKAPEVTEGLLPQHDGPEVYARARRVPGFLFWGIFIALPLCSFVLRFFLQRKALLLADPEGVLQRTAFSRFEKELQQPALAIIALQEAVLRYLGERFRLRGKSLTPLEALELLKSRGFNAEAQQSLLSLLEELQAMTYSGKAFSPDDVARLGQRAREVIAGIEAGAKR